MNHPFMPKNQGSIATTISDCARPVAAGGLNRGRGGPLAEYDRESLELPDVQSDLHGIASHFVALRRHQIKDQGCNLLRL
jgi:hypothetical protein